MNLDPLATRLINLLALQAKSSAAALAAGIAGDEAGTRKSVDALRVLLSKLQTIPKTVYGQLDQLPSKEQAAIQSDLEQIQRANNFIPAWCQRYQGIASYDNLRTTRAGVDALIDQTLPSAWDFEQDIVVLTHEHEMVFAPALVERGQKRIIVASTIDIGAEYSKIELAVTDTPEKLRSYFQSITIPYPARICGIRPPDTTEAEKIWSDIKHVFAIFLTNQNTANKFGNTWLTQGIQNLPAIADSSSLSALGDQLKGLPFIIIAPGPSLDNNIHLLKALKGRAVLMAAAQCAKTLSRAGIVPDFIVVIDPGDLVYLLDDVETSNVECLLVGVSCNPGFFQKKFKNRIIFNANANADRWISNIFEETIRLSSAGSVSVASVHIANYLQCGPLILVGQDLALKDGKQYSSDSAARQNTTDSDETEKSALELPGYYGGKVRTLANYHLFHGEFMQIASLENSKPDPRPMLNCTEGGAYIEGFQHVSLETAITRYISNRDENISRRISESCAGNSLMDRTNLILEKLEKMKRELEEAIRLASQCILLTGKKNISTQNLVKLNDLEKKLIKLIENIPAISLPNQQEVQQALSINSDAKSSKESNQAAAILYHSIVATGSEILPLIDKSIGQCNRNIELYLKATALKE